MKQFYDPKSKTLDLRKKNMNESKKNSKIKLPDPLTQVEEAYISMKWQSMMRCMTPS